MRSNFVLKTLLFFVFYVFWVMGSLAVIFGAFTSRQDPGNISFLAIILYLVVILIPIWLFNRWVNGQPGWVKTVLAEGKQAPATIQNITDSWVSVNRARLIKLSLHVEPPDEAPFDTSINKLASWLSVPDVGSPIQVKYDPANKKHIVIVSNSDPSYSASPTPRSNANARFDSQGNLNTEFEALRKMPEAGSHRANGASGKSISEELADLVQMHKSGDLSATEFEAAKKKLLD